MKVIINYDPQKLAALVLEKQKQRDREVLIGSDAIGNRNADNLIKENSKIRDAYCIF